MSDPTLPSGKYNVQIRDACGVVIGDNNVVYQNFDGDFSKPAIPRAELIEAVRMVSADLRSVRNTIAGIHLAREEVNEIIDWTRTSESEKRLAMLLDQPGGGKTVVMRDVLERLEGAQVPVLAIKADSLSGIATRVDLKDWLGLPANLEECACQLAVEGRFVVLLDQLDALSLTLTRDQAALSVMLSTLARLREMENVRIIASCRTFDLHNDPRLSGIKLDRTFELRPLNDAEVKRILQTIGVDPDHLLPSHRELLRVPLHLAIYVRTLENNLLQSATESFRSLQELYGALWRNQVEMMSPEAPSTTERRTAIYRLVDTMTTAKQVNAPHATLDDLVPAARYLEQEGLIRLEKERWYFLHQTFFDYCYARRFVATSSSLSQEVLDGPQGLFERSQIVQVLAYLRGTDQAWYLRELKDLLYAPKLRVHLRMLILGWLGALLDPKDDELGIVQRWATDLDRRSQLLRALSGNAAWFDLLDRQLLAGYPVSDHGLPVDRVIYSLGSVINTRTDAVLRRLRSYLGQNRDWDVAIAYCLSQLEDWRHDEAIQLQYDLMFRNASAGRENLCFHRIALSNPAGGCRLLQLYLDRKLDELLSQSQAEATGDVVVESRSHSILSSSLKWEHDLLGGYAVQELLTAAARAAPHQMVEYLLPWFLRAAITFTNEVHYAKDSYPGDAVFSWGWYDEHLCEGPLFAKQMGQALGAVARSEPSQFRLLAKVLADVALLAIHRVLAEAYSADPETYANDIADYLLADIRRLDIGDYSDSHYDSTRLYGAAFAHLTPEQRAALENLILDWQPGWEKRSRRSRGSAQLRFLKSAPRHLLSEKAVSRLQELERKFPHHKVRPPKGVTAGIVGPPIDKASLAKMSDENWLGAMRKYSTDTEDYLCSDDPLKGGVRELAPAFQDYVTASPERFYRLAGRFDDSISTHYLIAAISGLAESTVPATWVFDLVRRFAPRIEEDFRGSVCWALRKRAEAGVPDDLLAMIADWALHDPSPGEEMWQMPASSGQPYYGGDALQFGINTNRGAAVEALCHCALHRKPPQYERALHLLELAANDDSTAVRACVVHQLGRFLGHDESRTLTIFEQALQGHSILLNNQVAQQFLYRCYRRNFPRVRPYVEVMLDDPDDRTRQAGARLVCLAAFECEMAGDLAANTIRGDKAMRLGAAEVYARNLDSQNVAHLCKRHLLHLFDDPNEEVQAKAGECFQYLKPERLGSLRPFIDSFLASAALTSGAEHLIGYLKTVACDDYELTLQVTERLLNVFGGQIFDIRTRWAMLDDDLAQLPLAVYNQASDAAIKTQAMDLFERLLLYHSRSAVRALAEWDRQ